ncbi:MAG: hypothetical protein HZB18_04270 [Chloroflexi bacterium]|nr:hypothetical protein [Chloroflexota bacterium]
MKISYILKYNSALIVFLSTFALYGFSTGIKITEQSKTPQYVYLAYSFLHGHTDLVTLPESNYDLILFEDKWYVPGGITPALLLVPFVILFGKTFSDVLFGVLIGAVNATLMNFFLGDFVERPSTRFWLIVVFSLGTAHWWLSSMGSVWFNAQLVALLFMILYARGVVRNKPWLAGLWLGLAFLARPPTIFSALFYFIFILYQERAIQSILKKMIPFSFMLAGCIAVMLTYNQLRFGNPLDFGYGYVRGTNALIQTFARSGGFNVQYMSCNIYVSLFGMPNLDLNPLPSVNEACPYLEPISHEFGKLSNFFNPLGMSFFLASPIFLLIFRAKLRDSFVIPAWAGIIGILIPLWMYHTTGWVQFGYRYTTDFMVFLFILLASAIKQMGWLEKVLIGLSVLMGGVGVYLMYYMTFELVWQEMFIDLVRKIYHFVF